MLYTYLAEGQRKPDDPDFGEGVVLFFVVLWHLACIVVLLSVALIRLLVRAVLWIFGRRRTTQRRNTEPEPEVWRYGY